MESITVTIANWDKFNDRKEVKKPTWFRMENRMYASESLYGLTAEEKWAWTCLLMLASEKHNPELTFNTAWFDHQTGVKPKVLTSAVSKLIENGAVMSAGRNSHAWAKVPATDRQTDTTDRQDRQDRTDTTPRPAPPDLGELWNQNCGELSKVEKITPARLRTWKVRWGENPNLTQWTSGIQRLAQSDFCSGKGERGWKASVDFLLQPNTLMKALEGTYDNRNGSNLKNLNQELYDAVMAGKA